ncbi:hypothetical protein BaRGS_00007098, partial [Batillaria attramentaria]
DTDCHKERFLKMTPDNVHQPPEVFRPGFVLWRGVGAVGGRPPTVGSRPIASALVLLFTWLFSKPQAVSKYVQLYTRRGYDVLQISSKLSHFLWPPNSKAFAVETFGVLRQQFSEYEHYIVHGMSIGAYNYTSCIMLANKRPDLYYGHFTGKLRACVMDSLTIGSLDHMVNGIATGASQRTLVRRAIQCTASVYFGLTHNTTVEAFNEGVDFFKQHPAQVPTLVFACRNDPMSDADFTRDHVVTASTETPFAELQMAPELNVFSERDVFHKDAIYRANRVEDSITTHSRGGRTSAAIDEHKSARMLGIPILMKFVESRGSCWWKLTGNTVMKSEDLDVAADIYRGASSECHEQDGQPTNLQAGGTASAEQIAEAGEKKEVKIEGVLKRGPVFPPVFSTPRLVVMYYLHTGDLQ